MLRIPRSLGLLMLLKLAVGLVVAWIVCCGLLWWVYDIAPQIGNEYPTRSQALYFVWRMALILTVLICAAWTMARSAFRPASGLRYFWDAAWKTALVLLGYGSLVMLRREFWQPGQGINDDAMFLPLVGPINAHFFSEFRWLSYFLEMVPILAILSGLLWWIYARFIAEWNRGQSVVEDRDSILN